MKILNKYKYTIIFFIVLTIGGVMLNANYYINKRPITADKRVMVEEVNVSYFDKTRVLEKGKHVEENVILGFDPDFDWGQELSFTLEEKKTLTFENIPNFEYGSVTTEVGPRKNDEAVTVSSSIDASKKGQLFRPVYNADVEVTEYLVDVYGVYGKYKYSFNSYENVVVEDTVVLSIISEEDAKKQGLN